jgi:NAD(P)-dependent dehydrogenase (short-subunit alcohol dehydrogenase family)
MGMAIVRSLVKRGWKVAIADINENEEFAAELGEESMFCKCTLQSVPEHRIPH